MSSRRRDVTLTLRVRRPAQGKGAGCVVRFLYLTSVVVYEQLRKAENAEKLSGDGRCYHHKWNETSLRWAHFGDWIAGGRAHCRPTGGCQCRRGRERKIRRTGPQQCECGRTEQGRREGDTERSPRDWGIPEAVWASGRHSLAGSHWGLLSATGGCFCSHGVAYEGQFCSWSRPQNLSGFRRIYSGFSVPGREFILASAEKVNPTVQVSIALENRFAAA